MFRLVATCCAIAAFTFGQPLSAMADPGPITTYDTVDAVGVRGNVITVTGIISGQGAPTTTTYSTSGGDPTAARCDRLALLAMSKPGKFQFAVVVEFLEDVSCKLIVRKP